MPLSRTLLTLAVTLGPAVLPAATITFDAPLDRASTVTPADTTLDVAGHRFTVEPAAPGTSGFIEVGTALATGGLINANGAAFVVTRSDAGYFDAIALDIARRPFDAAYLRSAADVTLSGFRDGTRVATYTTGPLAPDYQHIVLPVSFSGLTALAFTPRINSSAPLPDNHEFRIDNLSVEPSPTLATLPLPPTGPLLAGALLAGWAFARRQSGQRTGQRSRRRRRRRWI